MLFEMRHKYFTGDVVTFSHCDAPNWITSAKTIKGSTEDYRWFWNKVMSLPVGESISTDFREIKRIA